MNETGKRVLNAGAEPFVPSSAAKRTRVPTVKGAAYTTDKKEKHGAGALEHQAKSAERMAENREKSYTTIRAALRKHLSDDLTDDEKDALVAQITLAVRAMHQVAIEGTRLANFTVLYALENNLMTNLVVDDTLLRKIFARLWNESNPPTNHDTTDKLLNTVFHLYRRNVPVSLVPLASYPRGGGFAEMLTYLAKSYLVECRNHVVGNFHKRFYGMVRRMVMSTDWIFNVAVEPKRPKKAKTIINRVARVLVRLVAQAILKKVWAGPDLSAALRVALDPMEEIRVGFNWNFAVDAMVTWAVQQYTLYKDVVPVLNTKSKSDWHLLLSWHHAIQKNAADTLHLHDPNLRARQFSLLPIADEGNPHDVTIDTKIMVQLMRAAGLNRLLPQEKTLQAQLKKFRAKAGVYWRNIFKLDRLHHGIHKGTHLFEAYMTTDGIAASFLYTRTDGKKKKSCPDPEAIGAALALGQSPGKHFATPLNDWAGVMSEEEAAAYANLKSHETWSAVLSEANKGADNSDSVAAKEDILLKKTLGQSLVHDDHLADCVGKILQDRHASEVHELLTSQKYLGDLNTDPEHERKRKRKRMEMELKSKHKQEVSHAIMKYSRALLMVGLDPGRRDIISVNRSAFDEQGKLVPDTDRLGPARRRKRKNRGRSNGKHRKGSHRKHKAKRTHRHGGKRKGGEWGEVSFSVSNRQWCNDTGSKGRQATKMKWLQADKGTGGNETPLWDLRKDSPSPKVATVENMKIHCDYVLTNLLRTMNFVMRPRVRRLNFQGHIQRTAALDDMCHRIHAGYGMKAVVVLGACRCSSGFGYFPAPIVQLRQRLELVTNVIVLHEHYTSQECSNCAFEAAAALDATYVNKLVPGKCSVTDDNGAKVYKKNGTAVKHKEVHGVRCCKKCKTTWNRDVNSGRSIRKVARWMMTRGLVRPQPFQHDGAFTR